MPSPLEAFSIVRDRRASLQFFPAKMNALVRKISSRGVLAEIVGLARSREPAGTGDSAARRTRLTFKKLTCTRWSDRLQVSYCAVCGVLMHWLTRAARSEGIASGRRPGWIWAGNSGGSRRSFPGGRRIKAAPGLIGRLLRRQTLPRAIAPRLFRRLLDALPGPGAHGRDHSRAAHGRIDRGDMSVMRLAALILLLWPAFALAQAPRRKRTRTRSPTTIRPAACRCRRHPPR